MKGLIITHPGIESVAALEIKELIKKKAVIKNSVALFETDDWEDFCTLCYRSQSAIRVLCLLFDSSLTDIEKILPELKQLALEEWLKNKTFAVRSKIIDNQLVDTMESERLIGDVIHEKYSEKLSSKVSLENPDIPFFAYFIEDHFYFGVDFAGFDLSKRNYRIFALADSIKATVAYALIRLSNYKPGMVFLDSFAHSGTVAIEAAIFASKKPVNFYSKEAFAFLNFPQLAKFSFEKFFKKNDSLVCEVSGITASDSQQRHVRAAEKNAKIAGLNKQLVFTRMDVEWLDTKFEKKSVDRIISNPPKVSRLLTEKGIEKIFQELFYTADFVLKSDGIITLLAKNYSQILKNAQRYNFSLKNKFPIRQGKEDFFILIFEKNK